MKLKADIVIIGSGAGGATLAKELSKAGRDVLLVERGQLVKELGTQRSAMGFYDKCGLRTSREGVIVYRALITGGTVVVSCGNGLPVLTTEFKNAGIDLTAEYEEINHELAISPLPASLIGKGSKLIMDTGNRLGFDFKPMPKFINFKKCVSCGLCVLGCKTGAKWSTIEFIKEAQKYGCRLITDVNIKKIVINKSKASGAIGWKGQQSVRIHAEKVILSAGGFGSAVILKKSGFEQAGKKIFADLFNVTYGVLKNADISLHKEPSMSVLSTKFMQDDGFILSPFIDVPLMLRWVMPKKNHITGSKYNSLLGIMTKIKDDTVGSVTEKETFFKIASTNDLIKLNKGSDVATQILKEAGVRSSSIFVTKPRGAHPGGTAAMGDIVNKDLKTELDNLYVCDASVLPNSPGAPPIVTIIALAKRLAKHILSGT
jgi:choline dehydrogenase-like flavoprotein